MHDFAITCPQVNILPSLRSLRVEVTATRYLAHSLLYFSPALVDLELIIWCERSNIVVTSLYKIFGLKSLTKLRMWGLTEMTASIATTFEILPQMHTLEHLAMDADTGAIAGVTSPRRSRHCHE